MTTAQDTMCEDQPGLWIAGLGHQYPPHALQHIDLERLAAKYYDARSPG